jgi:hypothetical protein
MRLPQHGRSGWRNGDDASIRVVIYCQHAGGERGMWRLQILFRLELQRMCSQEPALAQDGGRPIQGVLKRISPELRKKVVRDFLLTVPTEAMVANCEHH